MTHTIVEPPLGSSTPGTAGVGPQRRWLAYGRMGGAVLLALVVIAGVLWLWRPYPFHGAVLQSPEPATDFTLTASTGAPLRLSALRGKVVLLYFGYTACPDACPLTLADLTQTMQLLGKQADKVQVVLISVDPTHDTPQRLAQYLAAFDKTFLGMTGSSAAIDAVATQFGVFYDAPQPQKIAASPVYPIGHTSSVIVIDPAGYVRLLFPTGTSPADMAADLAHLIAR